MSQRCAKSAEQLAQNAENAENVGIAKKHAENLYWLSGWLADRLAAGRDGSVMGRVS